MLSGLAAESALAQAKVVETSATAGPEKTGDDLGRNPLSASPNDIDAQLLESDDRARGLGSLAPETGLHKAWKDSSTSCAGTTGSTSA